MEATEEEEAGEEDIPEGGTRRLEEIDVVVEEATSTKASSRRTPTFTCRRSSRMISSNNSVTLEEEKKEMQDKLDELTINKDTEGSPKGENEEASPDKSQEPKVVVSSTGGDGFFDDFSNSNLEEENTRGRGGGFRGGSRGGNRGRGNRGRGGYNQRARGGYNQRGRGGYQKNYDDYQHKPFNNKPFRNSDNEYQPKGFGNRDKPEYDFTEKSDDSSGMSFPEYKPPQAQYRGGYKRGSANQGMKSRTDRGRFSYFNTSHEDM